MTETADDRRPRIAEASAAAGLLLWRLLAVPLPVLWRDWIALLSIYWLFTIFASRSKSWPYVTAGAMILLAALYFQGQFSHTMEAMGLGS